MLTRKALNALLKVFVEDLISAGYKPDKVILFGSYFKGGVHPYSDVDIAIWGDFITGNSLDDYQRLHPILKKYRNIDVKLFPKEADAHNYDPFMQVIESTGKVIYGQNLSVTP
ncbi:MAG: nucleotidyltransferase domain-containing protein [Saprospiraceae bacterium]|nr:nucleotidyltransferase domain-containing protein [Saprospiraceae bacterium]